MHMSRIFACALAISAGLIPCVSAVGGESSSPFTVEANVKASSVRPGGELRVELTLGIPRGHLIYADSVEIDIAPGSPGRIAEITRPPASVKIDAASNQEALVYEGRAVFGLRIPVGHPEAGADEFSTRLQVGFQGCRETLCFLPENRYVDINVPVAGGADAYAGDEITATMKEERSDKYGDMGFLIAVVVAFCGGLMLSVSPCVYPLIPITAAVVSATGGARSWKRGLAHTLVYVFGLSVAYAVLGAAVARVGGAFGVLSSHWAVVTVVGTLLVVLSWSLFGAYDLQVPAGLRSRLGARRAGGILGLFAMGLVSGLAVSPCVAAPIAAALTYISTTGDVVLGATLLFATAWGMSALLILVGTFPGLAGKLPKAGNWMQAVKTTLGVMLVLAALYMLRPVLPTAMFTPWVAVPLVAFGLWRVARRGDPGASRRKLLVRAIGLTALVFGGYSGAGAVLADVGYVPVISELYPPQIAQVDSPIDFRMDYEDALRQARQAGQPVMMFFTTETCLACHELERTVFARDEVAREAERFVAIRVDVAAPELADWLLETYGVTGAPTVVWLSSAMRLRSDLTVIGSDISPEEFLRRMRDVR